MWKGPTLTQIRLFCSRGPVLLSSVQLYPYCVSVGYRHAELHYELLWTRPFSRICLWGGGFTLKRMKSNCLGHILYRNYLLKHVIGGKIAGKGRRWRRRKQLLDAGNRRRKPRGALPCELALENDMDMSWDRQSDDSDRKFPRKVLKLFSNRHIY